MKRGVKVWSEALPEDVERFLRSLPGDIIDGKTGAFVRKENNAVLIQYLHTKQWWQRKGGLTYVAFIDLRAKQPRIEYRVPISPLPLPILLIVLAVLMSFQDATVLVMVALWLLIVYAIHVHQRRQILRFIRRKMLDPVPNTCS